MAEKDIKFWEDFLNERAGELGLQKTVKAVMPRSEEVMAVTWVYEKSDGSLVDLGWNVEEAEASLRQIAGA